MAETLDERAELEIGGSKVMTPLADAMRLINDAEGGVGLFESLYGFLLVELFGSKEDVFAGAILDLFEGVAGLLDALSGIDNNGPASVS